MEVEFLPKREQIINLYTFINPFCFVLVEAFSHVIREHCMRRGLTAKRSCKSKKEEMQINNPDIGGEEQNHNSYFPSTIKE